MGEGNRKRIHDKRICYGGGAIKKGWNYSDERIFQKFDVVIAKNYLTEQELAVLQRIVSAYLDLAKDMAERNIPMTMADWKIRLDKFIEMTDRKILSDAGKISHELACAFAETEFEKYRIIQDRLYTSDFDEYVARNDNLKTLGQKISRKKNNL